MWEITESPCSIYDRIQHTQGGPPVRAIKIIEVKRTSDWKEDNWERADARATEQYADLEQGLTECLQETGWRLQRVNIVVGTKSVKTERCNEAMEKLAMPKAIWHNVRGKMMGVLLEEHDTISKSFWAQKLERRVVGMR